MYICDSTEAMTADTILDGNTRYTLVKYLNKGRHGTVILAFDKVGKEHVAIKLIDKAAAANKYVEREIKNQYKLRHPHIVGIYDIFLTRKHLAIVMEYAELGDLKSYVMRRSGVHEDEARWFFQQIILALDFAFRMGIVNRDIKLDNLMLTSSGRPKSSPLVKLGDFGLSKDILTSCQSGAKTQVGTVMYMAPEIIAGGTGQIYDAIRSDLWSCGVVLYTMLTGNYPFQRRSDSSLSDSEAVRAALRRILDGEYHLPEEKVSVSARSMLEGLLHPDPSKRFTIMEIMEHEFFTTNLSPSVIGYNDALLQIESNNNGNESPETRFKNKEIKRIGKLMRELRLASINAV